MDLETDKHVQNKQPEIERHKKCIIILTDIRENALFDKYLKKVDEPMKLVDEPIENNPDLSPIEIPDSDDEHIDDDNDESSSSEAKVIEILSDSD